MLRLPLPSDTAALLEVAVATGLFLPAEAEVLLGEVLASYHRGALGADAHVLVWAKGSGEPVEGWTYFAADAHAAGVWNVWWIGAMPARHGHGVGQALLQAAEAHARHAGGRLVIIETSALEGTARARAFYEREGYTECGRVPDFYGEGDAKVVFVKRIVGRGALT